MSTWPQQELANRIEDNSLFCWKKILANEMRIDLGLLW